MYASEELLAEVQQVTKDQMHVEGPLGAPSNIMIHVDMYAIRDAKTKLYVTHAILRSPYNWQYFVQARRADEEGWIGLRL